MTWVNKLYYGDCLTVMEQIPHNSIDLVYMDPPFNSNRNYNAIYKDETGRPLPDMVEAFCDTWELTEERERIIRHMPILMREGGIDDDIIQFWRLWMRALRNTQPRLLAYLTYMAERLLRIYPLMKPTASLYYHCDPTASHYIKALLDSVFGHQNFQNEITWQRTESHNTAQKYGNIADIVLFYSKGEHMVWNPLYQGYSKAQLKRFNHHDGDYRWYKLDDLTAPRPNSDSGKFEWRGTMPSPNRGWGYKLEQLETWWDEGRIKTKKDGTPRMDGLKSYLDVSKGKPLQNIWTDVSRIGNTSKERIGYDTQKPLVLLERIIQASSNEGDVVFDPFCGCATTMEAAQRLGRRWIGIDIAIHAIKRVAQVRLTERCGLQEDVHFTIEGVPRTLEGAQDLWKHDKFQFQKWAVEEVEGFCTWKRSADGGVDGRIYFELSDMPDLQSMVVEVKGGKHVKIESLRALRGVLDSEDALMAGLIVMEPLGKAQDRNFRKFMADAGDLVVNGRPYSRMQLLSVPDILEGQRFDMPNIAGRHELQPTLLPV